MTICEVIDETGRTINIKYWADGKVQVTQSHTYSTMYMLIYKSFYESMRQANPEMASLKVHNYASIKALDFVERERIANGTM